VEGDFHSGDRNVESHYSNTFTCFPVALRYHPARTSMKARVWGCQTAVVVGPAGEEIYTDDKGRIKVQFHWDREGHNDAASSCWIRVASFWAGQGWGAIHIPRIGQEVVVDFLEGDPDCPIVVGSVYNAVKTPPYSLPDNKTQSGIKSRSSKGGGTANYNEIRFEDKKGSEEILIHAEKDLTTEVEHDETRTVQHDRSVTVGNNETKNVGAKQDITIGSSKTEQVGSDKSLTVGGSETRTIASNRSVTIGSDDSLTAMTIEVTATSVSITAPSISITGNVTIAGTLMCPAITTTNLTSASVVSAAYSPGVGNLL
jgi:type VI secretion system secreted protein VgrG